MPSEYQVVIVLDALEVLPRTGKRRTSVIKFMQGLKDFAFMGGDFQVKDPETHRSFEVSLVSGYAVTWWIDAPVNKVMVVDIRPSK